MADVLDVAAAVVDQASTTGVDRDLTAMKLEKLVYYSQAWCLAESDVPLFGDPIEAWAEGPVVRRLFDKHRGARWVRTLVFGEPGRLTKAEIDIVRRVVDRYGRLSAERLSALTHRELPWRLARRGIPESARSDATIEVDVLRSSYRRDGASPEEAVELAVANSRLEWLTTDEKMLPVLHAVARGDVDVEDAVKARIAAI